MIGIRLKITALSMALLLTSQAQQTEVEIKIALVAGSVRMVSATNGRGLGNMSFSEGPDGLLLVDTLVEEWSKSAVAAIREVSDRPVKFIINTHWHGDHWGGNRLFEGQAVIIAHPNVRRRLKEGMHPPWQEKPTPPQPPQVLPVITVEDRLSLYFNGEEIRLIHFPHSHTDGDTVVYFTGSKVVCMGDTIYTVQNQLLPTPSVWSGGDAESLAKNLESLIQNIASDAKVIPGHGRPMDIEDLKMFHRVLTATIDTVRKGLAAGKSKEEIIAAGLPSGFEKWRDLSIPQNRWIAVIHESLSQKRSGRN